MQNEQTNKKKKKERNWSKIIKFRILAIRQMIVLGGGEDDGGSGGGSNISREQTQHKFLNNFEYISRTVNINS